MSLRWPRAWLKATHSRHSVQRMAGKFSMTAKPLLANSVGVEVCHSTFPLTRRVKVPNSTFPLAGGMAPGASKSTSMGTGAEVGSLAWGDDAVEVRVFSEPRSAVTALALS